MATTHSGTIKKHFRALQNPRVVGRSRQRHPRKDSIARKRKTAALDTDFLAKTLAGAAKLDEV